MGKWLELFRTLTKNSGIDGLTPGTPGDTCDTFDTWSGTQAPKLSKLSPGVSGVSRSIPLKSVNISSPSPASRNGSHFPAIPSSIEVSDVAAYDAALTVFCDFETRNTGGCDLSKAGSWRYAADPATEILCFGYRVGGVDYSWAPAMSSRDSLERLAADPAVTFVCFGGFESAVWSQIMVERHGFPPIETRRWCDLRATASSLALPRSLDKTLVALGLPIKKDKEGQRLVRSLSKPDRKTGAYPELTPAIVERVAEYNRIDIVALEVMRGQGLGVLATSEQAVWELDQKINARGIAIDVGFVEAAKRITDQVMGEAIAEFVQLTEGITPFQVAKIRDWLKARKWTLANLDADTVSDALELAGLPDDVRRVLEIRQLAAAASLKKLDAMLACVGHDGRARGLLQYHGATTGRWSGQLIQPQNFPRPTLKVEVDPAELAAAVRSGDPERLRCWGKPVDVLVSGLRSALTAAEGKVFGAGDFSMIECCVLLALAGQRDKCELITQGVDVYRDMAATIYGLDRAAFMSIPDDRLSPEETEQRRIGKNGVLSSGYQIGAEGFYRRFCRHVEGGRELAAKIVGVYRNQWAPAVPRLWRDLEGTARRAMQRPGQPAVARCGVVYQLATRVGLPCLLCVLPNGKLLHYANARIDGTDKWGRPRWVYNAYRQGQWREVTPYGGQLTENVASALARELLVDRMFALEAAGYPIVFTVHDEIVVEHPTIAKETMERIMSERPAWAEKLGVPVKAKAWVGKRYAKGAGQADDTARDLSLDSPFPARVEAKPASAVASVSVVERTPAAQVSSGYIFYEFFCGGGMARAGLGSGWFCAFANDNDPVKIVNYTRNWGGNGVKTADVARLTTADLPGEAALLWGSFPCQDLSEAGAGAALDGFRSNAIWPCLKLVRALRSEKRAPRAIVLENVTGLLSPRGGKFLDAICDALAEAGYRFGMVMIDAALFVPQSRERVFIVAIDNAVTVPADIVAPSPSRPFHPPALVAACERYARHAPIWWRLPVPPRRNTVFADLIEGAPTGIPWHSQAETDRLIAMMAPVHLAKLEEAQRASQSSGKRMVGGLYRRMRPEAGAKVQRAEVRFDDVAGCLRVPTGGSSRQTIMLIEGATVRSRLLSTREAARLMGLPDDYKLPANYNEGYHLLGDGVAVPAVRHLAEHILEPIIGNPWPS
jgi:DNA (cytosine-5)-methyltransferase 1